MDEKGTKKNIYIDFEKVLTSLENHKKKSSKLIHFLKSHFDSLMNNLKNFVISNDTLLETFKKNKSVFEIYEDDKEIINKFDIMNERIININSHFNQNLKFYKFVIKDKFDKISEDNLKEKITIQEKLQKNLDNIKNYRDKNNKNKNKYFEIYKQYWIERNRFMSGEENVSSKLYKNLKIKKNQKEDKYKKSYKLLSKKWNEVSEEYHQLTDKFNKNNLQLRQDLIMLYDLYTVKIKENFYNQNGECKIDLELKNKSFIKYSWERNKLRDFYYDFVFNEVKKENNYEMLLFKKNTELKKNVSIDNQKVIHQFLLMMLDNNILCTTEKKVKTIEKKFERISLKKNSLKYFLNSFLLCLFLKETSISFNDFVLEQFEKLIIKNIATFLENDLPDHESIFNITLICYEIFCSSNFPHQIKFSEDFLKLFRSLKFWSHFNFWEKFYNYYLLIFNKIDISLYFTNLLKDSIEKKTRVKNMYNIYQMIASIGFFFLKIPFERIFDILNRLNEKKESLPPSSIFDISKMFENKIKKKSICKKKKKTIKRKNKLKIVFKNLFLFLEIKEETLKSFLFLNKYFYSNLKKNILKRILIEEEIERQLRINIWCQIASLKTSLNPIEESLQKKSTIFFVEEKIIHILKMDVKRTNFVKNKKEELIKLLTIVSSEYPATSYYQGMNCIGGFILNYFDDFDQSKTFFEFLIKCRLEKYFLDSFSKLKKILFVAERIISIYLPKLHKHLQNLKITIEFFISPIILTVFCSSLQFIENYSLLAKIFDIFIIESWVGFFKIFVYIFKHIEKKLLEMDYDTILEYLNKKLYENLFYFNLKHFKQKCFSIQIRKIVLKRLEEEYDSTRKVVDEYWSDYYQKKRNQLSINKNL